MHDLNPNLVRRMMLIFVVSLVAGCATYLTPGAGVDVANLSKADADIAEIMKREPAASFPSRLAVVRIQSTGYYSRSNQCYGTGAYCVLTTRDIETEADMQRLGRLPMVAGVAPMSRILLPEKLASIKDLRVAAANLKTDILLVYSVATQFNVDSTDIGPLSLISLGFLPNKKAQVSTTASAALFDVRTGYLYGVAEATAMEHQRATMWSSEEAIENVRLKTEAESFRKLLGEVETLWKSVVESHAQKR